jgi:predicted enzyme related to lactoylglutathione lyase
LYLQYAAHLKKLHQMPNAINWFEIPVTDFERAKKFYSAILSADLQTMEAMGMTMAFFPADFQKGEIGGGIVKADGYVPSANGTVVYLNGGEDLSTPLSRVEEAGGKIVMPKTAIGPNGFMAHFTDTEGNKVAFHSMK